MSIRTLSVKLTGKALADNGIAQNQTLVGAGNLVLNGSFVSGGVADMGLACVTQRYLNSSVTTKGSCLVSITGAGNVSTVTFTVTGTLWLEDGTSVAQTDTITGVNTNIVTTTKPFSTVSQIAADGACATNVKAGNSSSTPGQLGAQYSAAISADDSMADNSLLHGIISTGASLTYGVDVSGLPFGAATAAPKFFAHSSFVSKTADYGDNLIVPFSALRIQFPANTWTSGNVTLYVLNKRLYSR